MDIPVAYLQGPATIINQSLDLIGAPEETILGDITDGTRVAEAARRNYGQGLRQLLRTAPWDWARKQATLQLLGDATGVTPAPGVSSFVEAPWSYAYAWPVDAVMGRWLPWTPTVGQPVSGTGVPLTTGTSVNAQYPQTPGRFLVGSSDQYPSEVGTLPWNQLPDFQRTEGVGPISRKIILTNCANASFVYTRLGVVIEEWDDLFRQAFVTMMALALVQVALEDPKERLVQRDRLIPILRNAIADARVANGNESGFPQSVDFEASFIRARSWGAYNRNGATPYPDTGGVLNFGYDYMNWMGSVF